jgi:hypothetical protein
MNKNVIRVRILLSAARVVRYVRFFVLKREPQPCVPSSRFRQYVSDFEDVITSDGDILFCEACGKAIVAQQGSQVTQHLSGSKHNAAVVSLRDRPRPYWQSLMGDSSATSSSSGPSKTATFAEVLCKAFVSADIRLFKINNPEISYFLLKYTQTNEV